MPQLWIVAGPNGAGKSTLVLSRLERRIPVVNPDVIAQHLPRVNGRLDERLAGQIALEQRNAHLARGDDFAIETTLTGNSGLRFLARAKDAGYKTNLVFVGLRSPFLCVHRVLNRVHEGGHAVPITALQRRYPDSLLKLRQAMPLLDRCFIFDNSDARRRLLLIIEDGQIRYAVKHLPTWAEGVLRPG